MFTQPKSVFAHFMVGNTYPYTKEDWFEDISLAASHEIDGFALNVGREEWQRDRVADCFEICLNSGSSFKLFLSLDMSSIPSATQEDLVLIRSYIELFGHHPNMLRINNGVVLSTFAGENSLFGFQTLEQAWDWVKAILTDIVPIHFIPSFFIDPARYPSIRAMDGTFNWNGSWPIHLSSSSSRGEIVNAAHSLRTDDHHLFHLRRDMGMSFMASISPWFFTHYGVDSWNKNWLYRCDDHLFMERWEQLIANRNNIDIVQIISWNDYGESHYISTVRGAQPNSQAWVDGFPHIVFLKLTAYYARVFRQGEYPPITKDEIFVWTRPHPTNAQCLDKDEERKIGKPRGCDLTEDRCWVAVFSSSPAESAPTVVTFEATSLDDQRVVHREERSLSYGIFKISFPLIPDTGIKVSLTREGIELLRVSPSVEEYCFVSQPRTYNYNVWTGYASSSA